MKKDPEYYLPVPGQEKILALVRRGGSSSMSQTIRFYIPGNRAAKGRRYHRSQVAEMREQGYEVVNWFREPFDRFASCYHMLKDGVPRKPREVSWTPDEFAEIAMTGDVIEHFMQFAIDHHWVPQTTLHTLNGVFLPTRVYKFDTVEETWPIEFPDFELARINVSENRMTSEEILQELSPKLRGQLERYYKKDTEFYNSL